MLGPRLPTVTGFLAELDPTQPKHVVVVIPQDGQRPRLAGEGDHRLAIGPLGHQIADQHQPLARAPAGLGEQLLQLVHAAVDVPYDDGAVHPRGGSLSDAAAQNT